MAGNFIVTLLLACCYILSPFTPKNNPYIYKDVYYGSPFLPGTKEEKRALHIFRYVKILTYLNFFKVSSHNSEVSQNLKLLSQNSDLSQSSELYLSQNSESFSQN